MSFIEVSFSRRSSSIS